jgi:hypothetical protein
MSILANGGKRVVSISKRAIIAWSSLLFLSEDYPERIE